MSVKRVLIVEDDKWLSELYEKVIKRAGYNACNVANTLEAIQAIDDFNPDIIVLDVLLTGTTALTLLHELQSYADTVSIPVVICTNIADELSLDNLRPYGVKRILDKTKMKPDDLVVAVKSVLL